MTDLQLRVPDQADEMPPQVGTITTVVVNWNTVDLLDDCLRSVVTDLPEGWANEIVVVDNASEDGSVAHLQRHWPQVRVIANQTNLGFGPANNQAFRATRSDVVLRIDTDARLTPGATAAMLGRLQQDPRAGFVGPRLVYGDGSFQRWTAGAPFTLRSMAGYLLGLDRWSARFPSLRGIYLARDTDRSFEAGWVSGCVMLIRRAALDDAGVFDDDIFLYMEDVDLCERARNAGWRVWYAADATAVHFMGASTKRVTGKASPEALRAQNRWFVRRYGRRSALPLRILEAVGYGGRAVAYGLRSILRHSPEDRRRAAAHVTHLKLSWEPIDA